MKSSPAQNESDSSFTQHFMSAWQLRDYDGIESLELVKNLPIPKIVSPKEVLVEVKAASVNPLDAWMTGNKTFKSTLNVK